MIPGRTLLRYDLFKLIVALILLALLIVWLSQPVTQPTAQPPGESGAQAVLPTAALPTAEPSQPLAESTATSALPEPTATVALPTQTPMATESAAATATTAPTQPAGATPTPTEAAAAALTPTPATTQPGCPLANDTRLQAGMTARVISNLNLRSSPEIGDNLIRVNLVGTPLEITGEAVCGPINSGAHLWWPVRMVDGTTGWSAESSATAEIYYLRPE